MRRLIVIGLLTPALGGCVANALIDVATAPVRIAGKAVDLATTSQSEADQNRGRELRKLEERYGKLGRDHRKAERLCGEGHLPSCAKRDQIAGEMDLIRAQIPVRAD